MNYQKVSCITMNSSENLVSFGKGLNVTVFGATGGIGKALTHNLSENKNTNKTMLSETMWFTKQKSETEFSLFRKTWFCVSVDLFLFFYKKMLLFLVC